MKAKKLIAGFMAAAMLTVTSTLTAFAVVPSTILLGTTYIRYGGANESFELDGVSFDYSAETLSFENANTYQGGTLYSQLEIMGDYANLNIKLTGNNLLGNKENVTQGISSYNTDLVFTGKGNLEILTKICAIRSNNLTNSFTFKPDEGYKMAIYVGNSEGEYKEIAAATEEIPLTIKASDTSYFNSNGNFNYSCLKIETTEIEPTKRDVMGTYKAAGEEETIYSVDIKWWAMDFTYTEPKKVWDAQKLKYVNDGSGKWSCVNGTNNVSVTNHSNAEIIADFYFNPNESHSDIAGTFTSDAAGEKEETWFSLPTAESYDDVSAGERSKTLYFKVTSGKLTEGTDVELGNIKIVLYDKNWGEI